MAPPLQSHTHSLTSAVRPPSLAKCRRRRALTAVIHVEVICLDDFIGLTWGGDGRRWEKNCPGCKVVLELWLWQVQMVLIKTSNEGQTKRELNCWVKVSKTIVLVHCRRKVKLVFGREKLTTHYDNIYADSSIVLHCSKNPEKSLITMNIRGKTSIFSLGVSFLFERHQTEPDRKWVSKQAGSASNLQLVVETDLGSNGVGSATLNKKAGLVARTLDLRARRRWRDVDKHSAC